MAFRRTMVITGSASAAAPEDLDRGAGRTGPSVGAPARRARAGRSWLQIRAVVVVLGLLAGVVGALVGTATPAAADTVTATLPSASTPNAVVVNPVTNKIYVANGGSGNVTVIDGATNTRTTVVVGVNPVAMAVNPVTNKVYVTNSGAGTVTVIDGATNSTATVTTGAVGSLPSAVAVNPVTNRVYVVNRNNSGAGTVTVIDGATNATATVTVGIQPWAVAVNPVTNRIYVTNATSDTVTVIDGATNGTAPVTVGDVPTSVAVNPVTNKIYVTNQVGNSVTVIDGATNTTATLAAGASPRVVAVNPVTNRIYVTNRDSGTVMVIDGATNGAATVVAQTRPFGVAVNPVTNKIYVTNLASNSVTVIDGATNATATMTAGSVPFAVAVNPVTNKVYVANSGNTVTVIDGATNATATVAAATTPQAVAVNPVTNKVYVANQGSDSVTVIDGVSNATATVTVGDGPIAVAVNQVTNKIYVANQNEATVTVIDGVNNATATVAVGAGPIAVAVNPVTNKIYVANFSSNDVTVIDGATNATATVVAGSHPRAVAVNPVTNKVYVGNFGYDVTVIDGATNAPTTVPTGTMGGLNAVAVNPVTNKVYLTHQIAGANVTVLDGATNTKVSLTAGTNTVDVAVNPVTNKVYVANQNSANVTVFDGATNATTATVAAGSGTSSLAVNPVTNKIYVANQGGNVTVIDGATNTPTTVTAGNRPIGVAVNPVTNKVYVANLNGNNVTVLTEAAVQTVPLQVAIAPLAGDRTTSATPTFSLTPSTTFSPNAPAVQQVLFQLDTWQGRWTAATPGAGGTFDATAPTLQQGLHVLYAYAADGQHAASSGENAAGTGLLVGNIKAYPFLVDLTVQPSVITWGNPAPITYGTALSGTQLNATANTPGTFTYTPAAGTVLHAGTGQSLSVTFAPTDAGYLPATKTVAIDVAKAALTVTATNASKVFGAANPTFTSTTTGFVNGDTASVVTGTPGLSTTATAASPAGTYPISVDTSGLSAADYTITGVAGTLTIGQATPVLTWADPAAVTYGTSLSGKLNATSSTPGAFSYTATGSGATVFATSPVTSATVLPSGTYTLATTFTPTDSVSYTAATASVPFTVDKAVLTVTAANKTKTYGAANPALTSTTAGFVNGDTAGVVTGAPALATTAVTGSGFGSYPITAAIGTLASANYTFTLVDGTLTVNKAVLTVTADNKSRGFGQANPTLTATTTGFVNGDTAASAVTGAPALSTTAVAGSAIGSYPITAAIGTLAAANYSFTFTNGTLAVTQLTTTLTWATPGPITYGTNLTGLLNASSGGVPGTFVYRAVGTGTTSFPIANVTTATVLKAGTYTLSVTFTPTDAVNNSSATASVPLTVNKAVLTYTAVNKTKNYGAANPALTSTVAGFVTGDTAANSVTGAVALSTTAVAGSPVGVYPITAAQGTLAAANYTFAFVPGTMTVNKVNLTFTAANTSRPYATNNPAFTFNVTGLVNGDTAATAYSGAPVLTTTATQASNAGSYPITTTVGTLAVSGNYNMVLANGTLTVSKVALQVRIDNASREYGDPNPDFTYTVTGFVNGDAPSVVTGEPTLTSSAGETSAPGTFSITGTTGGLTATNYSFTFVNGTLTVTKAAIRVTARDITKSYGEPNGPLSYVIFGLKNHDSVEAVTGTPVLATTATDGSGVGTYPITVGLGTMAAPTLTANYVLTPVNGTITVIPAVLTVTADDLARPFGAANPPLTSSMTGFVNGDDASVVTGAPVLATAATPSSAPGSYAITATQGDLAAANYDFTVNGGSLTVGRATLTVTADDLAKTYGEPNPALTYSVTGFANGDPESVLTGAPALSTTATDTGDAGSYPIAVSLGTLAADNYDIVLQPGTLTVAKADLTITAHDASKVYGQGNPAFEHHVTGFVNGDTASALFGAPALFSTATAGSGVGTYPITAGPGFLYARNYSFTFVDATLTVTPAELTVTAAMKSRLYGQANPALTYAVTGFQNGDPGSVVSGAPDLSTVAVPESTVGSYPIVVGPGTLDAANYTFALVDSTLVVSKAPLQVKATNATKVYGQANPTFEYTVTGFANGDSSSSLTGAPALASSAGTGTGIGAYPITAQAGTLASPNYSFQFADGTLTITKANLTVTATDKTRSYFQSNPALTYAVTGFVNGDAASVVTGTAALATTATGTSPVGAYPITITPGSLGAHNYTFTMANGTLTVTKAALTVKATNASRGFGAANPAFTYTITGYQGADTPSVVTGTPVLSTTATPTSEVGPYPITVAPGTLAATNYSFTLVPGTLTVGKAVLTAKADNLTRPYGAANPTLTYTITGFLNGDTASVVSGSPGLSTTATGTSPIGGYPISLALGTLAADNYTVAAAGGTLTVAKAALTVTATDKAKTFGQANPALTYAITGYANGQGASVVTGAPGLSTTATTASGAGAYPITITPGNLASANYSFTMANGTLTVNKATLTVTAANKSRAYGAANPAFTYAITGFVNGNTASVVTGAPALSTTATPTSNVGSYPITAALGTLAAANYGFAFTAVTLSVTPSPVNVVGGNATISRSMSVNKVTFTATVTSASNGAPVAGSAVTFTMTLVNKQKVTCTATTGANGVATCTTANAIATLNIPKTYAIATAATGNNAAGTGTGTITAV